MWFQLKGIRTIGTEASQENQTRYFKAIDATYTCFQIHRYS